MRSIGVFREKRSRTNRCFSSFEKDPTAKVQSPWCAIALEVCPLSEPRTETARLSSPKLLFAKTPAEFTRVFHKDLAACRSLLRKIIDVNGRRTEENTLVPFDELSRRLEELLSQPKFLFDVHPEAAMRQAGDEAFQEADRFATELSLNRELYEALAALDVSREPEATRYAVTKILRDFHLAGVDRDDATRARVKTLRDEITAIGQEFDKNIREDVRSIRVAPTDLEGLPDDFVKAHPADDDGKVAISTNYPDSVPVFRYARKESVRHDLMKEYMNRAHPANLAILPRLIERRDELARLLDYPNFAMYITADKMIGTADAAQAFVSKVASVAEPRARDDVEELLARKRRDVPQAKALERWDLNYYTEIVRAESYAFDAKLLRPYFEFRRVRDGLFAITSRMFSVRYRRVSGMPVWHPSVEVYDLYRGRRRLGRFYLDLHPRKDKYTHAAAAALVIGTTGHRLPQAALMCNFPEPDAGHGPALMDFSEVETFFHEFGHLLHSLLSGGVRWGRNAMGGIEWDFVEAPSQMLEEWVRDPEVLQTFALHHVTGEPVPADLIAQMRRAEAFGRAYEVQRQLLYATLSLMYYTRDATGIDTTRVLREAHSRFPLIPHFEGTHFQCSFGHLNGYSAIYYTYMWSLVIAKDLFSRFRAHGSLLDPAEAERYRDRILGRGSEKPAADLVKDFLGREMGFGPFEKWLREAG